MTEKPRLVDLWHQDISDKVFSPKVILQAQAVMLKDRTKGAVEPVLRETRIGRHGDERIRVHLDLPPIRSGKEPLTVLLVECHEISPYPALVRVDGELPITVRSQVEFLETLRVALSSPGLLAEVSSRVAKANEKDKLVPDASDPLETKK